MHEIIKKVVAIDDNLLSPKTDRLSLRRNCRRRLINDVVYPIRELYDICVDRISVNIAFSADQERRRNNAANNPSCVAFHEEAPARVSIARSDVLT